MAGLGVGQSHPAECNPVAILGRVCHNAGRSPPG